MSSSTAFATPPAEHAWMVVNSRPIYTTPHYYNERITLQDDDDVRHLRVLKLTAAPADDPSLDW